MPLPSMNVHGTFRAHLRSCHFDRPRARRATVGDMQRGAIVARVAPTEPAALDLRRRANHGLKEARSLRARHPAKAAPLGPHGRAGAGRRAWQRKHERAHRGDCHPLREQLLAVQVLPDVTRHLALRLAHPPARGRARVPPPARLLRACAVRVGRSGLREEQRKRERVRICDVAPDGARLRQADLLEERAHSGLVLRGETVSPRARDRASRVTERRGVEEAHAAGVKAGEDERSRGALSRAPARHAPV